MTIFPIWGSESSFSYERPPKRMETIQHRSQSSSFPCFSSIYFWMWAYFFLSFFVWNLQTLQGRIISLVWIQSDYIPGVCFCISLQFSTMFDEVNCSDGVNIFPPMLNMVSQLIILPYSVFFQMGAFTGLFTLRTLHLKWPAFIHLLSCIISFPLNLITAIDLIANSFQSVHYFEDISCLHGLVSFDKCWRIEMIRKGREILVLDLAFMELIYKR